MKKDRARFDKGVDAEAISANYLKTKGFEIIGERVRTPLGEIDLIAARGDLITFIEVKARDTLEGALEAISPRQRRRIYAAAEVWLAENPPLTPWNETRFDVILVLPSGAIRHLENVDMST